MDCVLIGNNTEDISSEENIGMRSIYSVICIILFIAKCHCLACYNCSLCIPHHNLTKPGTTFCVHVNKVTVRNDKYVGCYAASGRNSSTYCAYRGGFKQDEDIPCPAKQIHHKFFRQGGTEVKKCKPCKTDRCNTMKLFEDPLYSDRPWPLHPTRPNRPVGTLPTRGLGPPQHPTSAQGGHSGAVNYPWLPTYFPGYDQGGPGGSSRPPGDSSGPSKPSNSDGSPPDHPGNSTTRYTTYPSGHPPGGPSNGPSTAPSNGPSKPSVSDDNASNHPGDSSSTSKPGDSDGYPSRPCSSYPTGPNHPPGQETSLSLSC